MKEIIFIVEHPCAETRSYVTFARARERYEHIFDVYLKEEDLSAELAVKRKKEIMVWRAECERIDPEIFKDS